MITPSGVVTTLAGSPGRGGSADGDAASAGFGAPSAIAISVDGSLLISDTGGNRIRKLVWQ